MSLPPLSDHSFVTKVNEICVKAHNKTTNEWLFSPDLWSSAIFRAAVPHLLEQQTKSLIPIQTESVKNNVDLKSSTTNTDANTNTNANKSNNSVGQSLVLTDALRKRGLAKEDPLRKRLEKRQKAAAGAILPKNNTSSSSSSSIVLERGQMVSSSEDFRVKHWSMRTLGEMNEKSWAIFRQQLGIEMQIIQRNNIPSADPITRGPRTPPISILSEASKVAPIRCWEEVEFSPPLAHIVSTRYLFPTPIQSQCVPLLLYQCKQRALQHTTDSNSVVPLPKGDSSCRIPESNGTGASTLDILGIAETGSGKTGAYLIPAIAKVLSEYPKLLGNSALMDQGPFVLIIVPTRELAEQVLSEAEIFLLLRASANTKEPSLHSKETPQDPVLRKLIDEEEKKGTVGGAPRNTFREIRVVKVVGGESRDAQYDALSMGAHLVVGTVGQLDSLLEQRLLSLRNVRMVIIDEADRIIEDCQRDTLVSVLRQCPQPRQTLLFSATLSTECELLAKEFFSPQGYAIIRTPNQCAMIKQNFEVVPSEVTPMPRNSRVDAKREDQLDRPRLNSLIHPIKFQRLVTWLLFATPPIVVFVNEKQTCDVLQNELMAEYNRLKNSNDGALSQYLSSPPEGLHWIGTPRTNGSYSIRIASAASNAEFTPQINLKNLGSIATVHAELSQSERKRMVELFKSGSRQILLTTDLLARGLDVPGVRLVINYDLPWPILQTEPSNNTSGRPPITDPLTDINELAIMSSAHLAKQRQTDEAAAVSLHKYIHRIGRTGRAGTCGVALSFIVLPIDWITKAKKKLSFQTRIKKEDTTTYSSRRGEPLSIFSLADDLDMNEDYSDQDEEDGSFSHPRKRARPDDAGETANDEGKTIQQFSSDEIILKPLYNFLLDCAERYGYRNSKEAADALGRHACDPINLPRILFEIMQELCASSKFGTIIK